MKKEISAPVAIGIIAALVLIAVIGGMLWNRAANPVVHIRSGDSFDMKTGTVIHKGDTIQGSAATGAGATPAPTTP